MRGTLLIHLLGMLVAVSSVGCGSDQDGDGSALMEEAIQEACAGNCEQAMQCGFDDEVEACTEECVDSLSAGLASRPSRTSNSRSVDCFCPDSSRTSDEPGCVRAAGTDGDGRPALPPDSTSGWVLG